MHPVAPSAPLTGTHAVVVNWRDLEHSLAGGSERYAWEYATALREAGARVEFITARDRGQRRHDLRDGIVIHRGGGAFGFYAFAAWSLLKRRRTLDVVIDPECGIPSFSPLYVRRSTAVVLVVHHVHQEQFTTYFPAPLARLGQWLERVAMRRVYRRRRTVAVSESTRDEMFTQLDWDSPVSIIGNGTTAPPVTPGDGDPASVEALLAKDPDRLLVLGRLVPHKRVDLVLRAMHALRDERPALHLDVCGKGPQLDRLRWIAADLDLADRVTFHGYVAEGTKQALLRRAALHVCASDIEGWGQVVIEAAGYGIPTVARDVPGLRDSIRDGETGWLVPDSDDLDVVQARLVGAVRTALDELEAPERRRQVFESRTTWAAGFSWSRMHHDAVDLVVDERQALQALQAVQGLPRHANRASSTSSVTAAPAVTAATTER